MRKAYEFTFSKEGGSKDERSFFVTVVTSRGLVAAVPLAEREVRKAKGDADVWAVSYVSVDDLDRLVIDEE